MTGDRLSGGGLSGGAPSDRLHSRYAPEAEADRYVEALNLAHDIDFFILVEPGRGYLVDSLRRLRPAGRAVVLHADAAFRGFDAARPGVPAWHPGGGKTVQEFLEGEIPQGATARIVEWRPSVSAYGEACLRLVRESAEFLRRAEAGRRTAAAFGRRWVRNFFRNLAILRTVLLCGPVDMPIVVTGAGPSLEGAARDIRRARGGVFVLAASSSVAALAAGGVEPDMVVSSDGGGWALFHLHACFRSSQGRAKGAGLASALVAALPSRCSELPILPLCDGSLWQSLALGAAGVPFAVVPERGTVTATALELALSLGRGCVFMAGMDLSVQGLRSHARPYGFDHLFFGTASRLRPAYSQVSARSRDIGAGGSYGVYADWFKSRLASLRGRVFALGGGHGVFESGPSLAPFAKAAARRGGFREVPAGDPGQSPGRRCELAARALAAALEGPRSAALAGELAPLLFPSRRDVSAGEISADLRGLAGRYARVDYG